MGKPTAPTGTVFTEPFATTFPLTITIDSGYVDYLEDITGNVATVSGPTTVTTDVVQSGDMIYFINSIETETATFTQTVVEGTQVLEIPVGTTYTPVTLIGPTDYTVTYTQAAYFATDPTPGVIAGGNTADPHCNLTAGATLFSNDVNRFITYAYQYVSLDAGQTTVTDSPLPIITTTEEFGTFTILPYSTSHTFIGPTIFSLTTTQDLFNSLIGNDNPGLRCGGICGSCAILFPTVSVLYFPVASPNTACLSTTMAPGNMSASGIMVHARGLSGLSGDGSTLVNSNGFTFTSPSIYIVFPTISAVDACGILGSVHTSTTIGFAPNDVSSVALVGGTTAFNVFNPADAQCPPLDATVPLYSIIGQTGYNPIISPPAGLTLLDPAWAGGCVIAEFQGNDPPFALIPQTNLSPTTTLHPGPINTPASPSSAIPAIPAQTQPPNTATMFSPHSATASLNAPASSPPAASPSPPSSPPPIQHNTFALPSDAAPPSDPTTALPAAPNDPPSSVTAGAATPSSPTTPAAPPSPLPTLTLNGHAYTATSGIYLVGSQTLRPGGAPITISATPIALAPGGTALLVGSSSSPMPLSPLPSRSSPPNTPSPEILTLFSTAYTANAASAFLVGSQTLRPGGAVTVSGEVVSLAATPTVALVGPSTELLGTYILNPFVAGGGGTVVPFRGGAVAGRGARGAWVWVWGCWVGVAVGWWGAV
ncbi:hypothetical protein MMC11_000123 [Xylographa trunciseda]|nr:hypothetical protein [Xylographa trunciseda]